MVWLAIAAVVSAGTPSASQLYKAGLKAERAGDVVKAYLLYSQAAALDASHPEYWARSMALRTRALMKSKPLSKPGAVEKSSSEPEGETPKDTPNPPGFWTAISEDDLKEVRRLKLPPDLTADLSRKDLDFRGDAKFLFDQTARAFGLGTVFDPDYEAGSPVRVHVDNVDYREALRAVEAATNSFVFPVGRRLVMVVKDTPQKRAEREPTIAVTVEVPQTVTPQEAQEVGRAVQQAMDIQKLAVDSTRRMVLIRDRISKVRPAQILFEQLAESRPQVMIEMEFLEVDRSSMLSYGFLMPTKFPMFYLGRDFTGGTLQSLAKFFLGHTTIGLGIANAQLFATMNESTSKTLLHAQVRSLDGQAATFHVGDKYPITTSGFLGGYVPGLAPSINFEDLGLALKVTPRVHGSQDVSLDVEAEFKVLSGQSINGVPMIANRKLQSKVRVREGEWGVIAGLMSTSEARQITGLPGLIRLPFLRENDRNNTSSDVLVLVKPTLISTTPADYITRTLWLGSEGRFEIPL